MILHLPSLLLLASTVRGICYFPAVYQGEFVSQAALGSEISYSTITVLYDSIPVWGYCHRRIGNNVILMEDSGGLTCFRCFHLALRSSNVVQVHTRGLDKCFTSEEAAVATCPSPLDMQEQQATEVMLYRTKGFLGEPAVSPTYCPFNGAYTFTYSINDGTETELCSLLKLVGLEYLSEREGLWDNARPWGELLSLGEQQALGIARLLYAKPQYAVLDECLSAVSTEVQAAVYKALSDRKIATVAIMHEVSEVATPYFSQELKLGQAVPAGWSHESRASNSESVLDGPDAVDEELKLESADEEDKDDNPPPPASP